MANLAHQEETFEEEYQEYDEFDDEDDDRGLSGFAVLIMGIVMIGAFVSVVWIAYKQGMKVGRESGAIETPYVAADPEPIKIETAENGEPVVDREVYDALGGKDEEPVTTLAEGPEEPVTRSVNDPIGAIASQAEDVTEDVKAAVNDRVASLQQEDAAVLNPPKAETPAARPAPAASEPVSIPPARETVAAPAASSGDARSGTHVVQVGAFRSDDEAMGQWARMQAKLGDYLAGKGPDVEVADLGDRGVYHRLRIGPFKSSDDAKTYCAGLKERGQDCLIKAL
ncbi:MAG: SPOR domain-containing protein [Parvularculaceae bacterium]